MCYYRVPFLGDILLVQLHGGSCQTGVSNALSSLEYNQWRSGNAQNWKMVQTQVAFVDLAIQSFLWFSPKLP